MTGVPDPVGHPRKGSGVRTGEPICDTEARDERGTLSHDPRKEPPVTETTELTIIDEALAVIDKGLADMLNRELVSTDEVADLLLDVRSLLVTENSVN
jgi:hypothetical protein